MSDWIDELTVELGELRLNASYSHLIKQKIEAIVRGPINPALMQELGSLAESGYSVVRLNFKDTYDGVRLFMSTPPTKRAAYRPPSSPIVEDLSIVSKDWEIAALRGGEQIELLPRLETSVKGKAQRIHTPPGRFMDRFADFFYSAKTRDRVMRPTIADMQTEILTRLPQIKFGSRGGFCFAGGLPSLLRYLRT
jgi:hypothetical protein